MRFYNIEMKGKFKLTNLSSPPSFNSDNEGRLMYYDDTLYLNDSTAITSIGAGGGGTSSDALTLDGQPGSYYLCRDNHTGLNDLSEVSGVLAVEHGGTGVTDSTSFIGVFGFDDRYGQLDSNNIWNGNQTVCDSDILMCGSNIGTFCWRPSQFAPQVNISPTGFIMSIGTWNAGESGLYISSGQANSYGLFAATARDGATAVMGCHSTTNPARIGVGVCAHSDYGHALSACANASSFVCCYGVYARSNGAAAVAGNTAYCNLSSKNLKHLNKICLSNCVRETPLSVYKYYWEDSNNYGFFQSIGPVAEDFNNTFNVDHINDGDGYEGVWTVDGAALGIGLENIKEIDKLKDIVTQLYSCIQKLEA